MRGEGGSVRLSEGVREGGREGGRRSEGVRGEGGSVRLSKGVREGGRRSEKGGRKVVGGGFKAEIVLHMHNGYYSVFLENVRVTFPPLSISLCVSVM